MICIKNLQYIFILLCVFVVAQLCQPIYGDIGRIDKERVLNKKGYSTRTEDDIINIVNNANFFYKILALELLFERSKDKSMPVLINALEDDKIQVRRCAAHLLGELGNPSGYLQMKKDFDILTRDIYIHDEPNSIYQNSTEEYDRKRRRNLNQALNVARVLAELDDRCGYELAVINVFDGPSLSIRVEALLLLIEVAKTDLSILYSEGKDPILILSAIAAYEKNKNIYYILLNQVANNLSRDVALPILEIAKESIYQEAFPRHVATLQYQRVKDNKHRQEKKLTRVKIPDAIKESVLDSLKKTHNK